MVKCYSIWYNVYRKEDNITDVNFNKSELFGDCYYEVLCRLKNKINELVDTVNELETKLNEQNQ